MSVSLAPEPKLRTLAMELNEVVHWFSLGVFLGVPSHELERVRLIHSYRRDGLIEMLDLWLKGGDANYRDLITALQFCGLTSLAQKLTVKHGTTYVKQRLYIPLSLRPVPVCNQCMETVMCTEVTSYALIYCTQYKHRYCWKSS